MVGRRRVAAAFGICTLVAFVALPPQVAGAATGAEMPISDPVMQTPTTAWDQRNFNAVYDGTQWFVVWAENRGGGLDIMGARVRPDGSLPDGDGITISTGLDGFFGEFNSEGPSVEVDGNGQFLVAWSAEGPDGRDVRAARVSAAGRVLDPIPIGVSVDPENDGAPSLAWNGSVFMAVFQRSLETSVHTRATLITTTGDVTPLGEVAAMSNPDVAASGSTFLAVGDRGPDDADEIVGRRIDTEGNFVSDAFPITDVGLPGRQNQAVVAGGTDGWIAAWADQRNGPDEDVYATRVAADGSVTDPDGIEVSAAAGSQDVPEIGIKGNRALVIWRDDRDGETSLFGAHVSPQGEVAEPDGIAISDSASADIPGAVVTGPGGGHTVVYGRVATEAPYGGVLRGFVRTVSAK